MKRCLLLTALAVAGCASTNPMKGWSVAKIERYDKDPKCWVRHYTNPDHPDTVMSRIECPTD